MSSAGIGTQEPGWRSYLSELFAHRTVAAADVGGPGPIAAVPGTDGAQFPNLIHLQCRLGPTNREVLGALSDYGRTSSLQLFVNLETQGAQKVQDGLLSSGDRADILVWVWTGSVDDEFPTNPADLNDNSKWCLVKSQSVTCSTLIQLDYIPALPIVVTVPYMANVGTVKILYRRNE